MGVLDSLFAKPKPESQDIQVSKKRESKVARRIALASMLVLAILGSKPSEVEAGHEEEWLGKVIRKIGRRSARNVSDAAGDVIEAGVHTAARIPIEKIKNWEARRLLKDRIKHRADIGIKTVAEDKSLADIARKIDNYIDSLTTDTAGPLLDILEKGGVTDKTKKDNLKLADIQNLAREQFDILINKFLKEREREEARYERIHRGKSATFIDKDGNKVQTQEFVDYVLKGLKEQWNRINREIAQIQDHYGVQIDIEAEYVKAMLERQLSAQVPE